MNEFLQTEVTADAASQCQPNHCQRILVANGDSHARAMNAVVLMKSGYKVQTVANGADAWKALNGRDYDLLITEYEMSEVTGMQLLKDLRSNGVTIPVIMASGTVPMEELERHPWLRLDAALPKPFTIAELLDTVRKVLSATDNARSRVELDFPVVIAGISQIKSSPHHQGRPL